MKSDYDEKWNPWTADILDEYLYFVCPECDFKHQSREIFIGHALEHHPKSIECISKIKVKEEITELNNGGVIETLNNIEDLYDEDEDLENYQQDNIDYELPNYVKCEIKEETNINSDDVMKSVPNSNSTKSRTSRKTPILKSEEENEYYKCNICDKQFEQQFALNRHNKYVHEKPHKCDLCDKKFGDSTKLKDHIDSFHVGLKKHQCKLCERSFGYRQHLSNHVRNYHSDHGLENKCIQCNKDFCSPFALRRHHSVIHEGQRNNHEPSSMKKHICEICGNTFTQAASLRTHKAAVHEGQGFKCDLCEKTLTSAQMLKKHIAFVHEGQKNVKCEICSKAFSEEWNLKQHMKNMHEGGESHTCEHCGKTLRSQQTLKHHIATVHEGLKKFCCQFCDKSFAHRHSFKCHVRTVHKGLKYQCDSCEKSFTQSNNLKQHMKKVHE